MKRNIDTDPSIEQRLFSSASQVEVKTTSAQILKAYQAKPQEKKDMSEFASPAVYQALGEDCPSFRLHGLRLRHRPGHLFRNASQDRLRGCSAADQRLVEAAL
jgi:hypothetical protein